MRLFARLWGFCSLFLLAVVGQNNAFDGALLVLEAGTTMSPSDMLYSGHNYNRTDPYYHQRSLKQLLTGGDFRSYLLDEWSDLEATKLEFHLYNSDMFLMKTFRFTGFPPDLDIFDVVDTPYLSKPQGKSTIVDSWPWAPMYLSDENNIQEFAFLSLQLGADGTQYILAADGDYFQSLPSPMHKGCYDVLASELADVATLDVQSVTECSLFCLHIDGCAMIAIYQNQTGHFLCSALSSLSSGSMPSANNCGKLCPDENVACGATYNGAVIITATLYNIAIVRTSLTALSFVPPSVMDVSFDYQPFLYETRTYIQLDKTVIINGIRAATPGLNPTSFTLAISKKSCNETSSQIVDRLVHGYNTNNPTIFDVNQDHTIAPALASCIVLEFNETVKANIYISNTTGTLIKAKYLVVSAEWQNDVVHTAFSTTTEPCAYREVMSDTQLIPDSAITIQQKTENELVNYQSDDWIVVPGTSFSMHSIHFHMDPNLHEFWLHSIEIESTVEVSVHFTAIASATLCTNQASIPRRQEMVTSYDVSKQIILPANQTRTFDLGAEDVLNGSTFYCVETLEVDTFAIGDADYFEFRLKVFGCLLAPYGDLYTECTSPYADLLGSASLYYIAEEFSPSSYTTDSLRPNGPGAALGDSFYDPFIMVWLTQDGKVVPVEEITLNGNIHKAYIEVGSYASMVDAYNGVLHVNLQGEMAAWVNITNIERSHMSSRPFTFVTMEIVACVIDIQTSTTPNTIPTMFTELSEKTSTPTTPLSSSTSTTDVTPGSTVVSMGITPKPHHNITTMTELIPTTSYTTESLQPSYSSGNPFVASTPPISSSGLLSISSSVPVNILITTLSATQSGSTSEVPSSTTSTTTFLTTIPHGHTYAFPTTSYTPITTQQSITTATQTGQTITTTEPPQTTTVAETTIQALTTTTTTKQGTTQPTTTGQVTTQPPLPPTIEQGTTQPPPTTTTGQVTTQPPPPTTTTGQVTNQPPPPTTTTEQVTTQPPPPTTTTGQVTTQPPPTTTTTEQVTTQTTTTEQVTTQPPPPTTTTEQVTTQPTTTTMKTTTDPSTSTLPQSATTTNTSPASTASSTQHQITTTQPSTTGCPTSGLTTQIHQPCCVCLSNQTLNITNQELQAIVETLIQNLTVPAKGTKAYMRSKTSAPDPRTSSKVIGTMAGAATLSMVGGLVLIMDLEHFVTLYNLLKTWWVARQSIQPGL